MTAFGDSLRGAQTAEQPLLMGVLNLTPDSFFDGGQYVNQQPAERQVDKLLADGADIIDIGAESSRPGAANVSASEQLRRLGGSVEYCVTRGALVSIDTTSPEVAEQALRRGAHLINDVSCLRDRELAAVAARYGATLVLTHVRRPMKEMAGFSQWPDGDYPDIVADVALDWGRARKRATEMGLSPANIIFDPGLGFSKNARQSFELLQRLREFSTLGAAMLVGPGRKSFISAADPSPPSERLGGTIAASLIAAQHGADILRVHDVKEVRQALRVWYAVQHPDRLKNPPASAAPDSPCPNPPNGEALAE